jgi:nicotinamidase-related amidase
MTELLMQYVAGLKQAGVAVGAFDGAGLTAADSLIVVDMQHDFLPGGSFGVAEGDATLPLCVDLIQRFAAAQAGVYATRDYHPVDHCSFSTQGGPFPPHCIQASNGSLLHSDIATALQPHVTSGAAKVVFKGFANYVDSFGAMEYAASDVGERVSTKPAEDEACRCTVSWTGSFALFSSNMATDCNAPPDVMAVLNKQPLGAAIVAKNKAPASATQRVFVVGLALDFCVLDSAINASRAGYSATIVIDACRAAHIPAAGGFLTPAAAMAEKLARHNVQVVAINL